MGTNDTCATASTEGLNSTACGAAAEEDWVLPLVFLSVVLATALALTASAWFFYGHMEIAHPIFAVLMQESVVLVVMAWLTVGCLMVFVTRRLPAARGLASAFPPIGIGVHQISWFVVTSLRYAHVSCTYPLDGRCVLLCYCSDYSLMFSCSLIPLRFYFVVCAGAEDVDMRVMRRRSLMAVWAIFALLITCVEAFRIFVIQKPLGYWTKKAPLWHQTLVVALLLNAPDLGSILVYVALRYAAKWRRNKDVPRYNKNDVIEDKVEEDQNDREQVHGIGGSDSVSLTEDLPVSLPGQLVGHQGIS